MQLNKKSSFTRNFFFFKKLTFSSFQISTPNHIQSIFHHCCSFLVCCVPICAFVFIFHSLSLICRFTTCLGKSNTHNILIFILCVPCMQMKKTLNCQSISRWEGSKEEECQTRFWWGKNSSSCCCRRDSFTHCVWSAEMLDAESLNYNGCLLYLL